jgi:hypothetical protein
MENNFGLILLDSVRKNKDKYLGLLRRNGVLVNTSTSNEDLANMILKAMQKSDSFKKEAILLMGVLMSERNDGNFANVGGYFGNLPKFDENFFTSPGSPSTTTTNTKPTTTTKKDFADTTVGGIVDKLFTLGNKYLENKELDVRKVEAETGGKISDNKVILDKVKEDNPDEKSNVGLYIGLGVGGLALVGVLVYVIAKKQ